MLREIQCADLSTEAILNNKAPTTLLGVDACLIAVYANGCVSFTEI